MSGSRERPRLLLATDRDWLAASIEGVLDHESVEIRTASTVDELEHLARRMRPDEVVLDQDLAGPKTPELCGRLTRDVLGTRIPLIVYSSELRDEDLHTRVVEAGAWTVMQEPVRSRYLVATLRRLLTVSLASRGEAPGDLFGGHKPEVLDRAGVLRRLSVLEALARRYESPLSVVAVGPGQPGSGELRERQRRRTAELCRQELRKADLFGWLGDDGDVVILAYGASREGARSLAMRLAHRAADRSQVERPEQALSVGIVELRTGPGPEEGEAGRSVADQDGRIVDAAQEALRRARASGGGIEFAT